MGQSSEMIKTILENISVQIISIFNKELEKKIDILNIDSDLLTCFNSNNLEKEGKF